VSSAGLKLDVYFGDSLSCGGRMASEVLMECFDRHGLEVAALYRGIEGFGIGRRIHTARFPDVSTDLPLVAEAIDTRERIEGVLADVDAIVAKGLVTIEHSRLAVGDDVRAAGFPQGAGCAGRLTVYCGRGARTGGRAAYRAVVELMRRHGASGATVLLGVDGIHDGQRHRAGLLRRNVDVPMAIVAVGPTHVLERVLQALPGVLGRPIANLERIAVVKHDGDLLEPLPLIDDPGDGEPPVWIAVRVYTRQSARADGGAIFTVLTRRLREAGAAGVTTIRGEWGFSSDERPFGDRFGRIASHVPTYTVVVDRPGRVARLWPIIDEITAEHGVVTAAFVPAYRERAGGEQHGRLAVPGAEDIAALDRSYAASRAARTPTLAAGSLVEARTGEQEWARSLIEQVREFAERHDRPQPLVRATLSDGEQFFLAALEPRPGNGFVTLYPHPDQAAELAAGHEGSVPIPRSVVVPLSRITKVELLAHVPRGTRSSVGFLLPTRSPGPAAGPDPDPGSGEAAPYAADASRLPSHRAPGP
jgi:PII-like signaling protein